MLTDKLGRIHNYLRIALTDSCNFRCTYCMPGENISFMHQRHLMSCDEIYGIAKEFVSQGVNKIRLTGGEPLTRKDAPEIIRQLSKLPCELTITTNGSLVHQYIDVFREAGIKSLNVSLDTLNENKFTSITKRNSFQRVLDNIHLLLREDFHVKINVVVMKGVNDHEVLDFIELSKNLPLHIRFIEFMPFNGNRWDNKNVFTCNQILELVAGKYDFVKMGDARHDTARKYKIYNHEGTFAVIASMTNPFCGDCNRMRLTADGKMKNCLFSNHEVDLLTAFRKGEDIGPFIQKSLDVKFAERGGQFIKCLDKLDAASLENRSMVKIGG